MTTILDRARLTRSLVAAIFSAVLLLAAPVTDAYADSLREVAERVARQHDGKVIAAREVQRNGRRFYEIRILTREGVVRTIRVPADDRRPGSADSITRPSLDGNVQETASFPMSTDRSSSAESWPIPNARTGSPALHWNRLPPGNPAPVRD